MKYMWKFHEKAESYAQYTGQLQMVVFMKMILQKRLRASYNQPSTSDDDMNTLRKSQRRPQWKGS